MFTLEELLVRPNDDISLLIEKRATLFLSKSSHDATTIYMSPDVYSLLLKQQFSRSYASIVDTSLSICPPHPMNLWRTTKCEYILQVLWHTKSFLMVTDKTQYDLYMYNNGLPVDLMSALENEELNKAIEVLLTNEEEECLQPWATSCGGATKKVGSHLEMAISLCVSVLMVLFQKTCTLLRLG